MACQELLLGLDLGTTAVKAVLFDLAGREVASASREYALDAPAPGVVEADAETYWNAAARCLREAAAAAGRDGERIAGLSVSSQGETFVPVDSRGRPLRRVIVWLDSRAGDEAREIARAFPIERFQQVTGMNDISPLFDSAKLLWLRRREPAVFARVARFPLLHDYLLFRLTGEWAAEGSVACTTGLFDLQHYRWWSEMLDFVGVREDQLCPLRRSGELVGRVTPEAAAATGLPAGTPVCAGAMDQMAAAVGAGNVRPGPVSASLGSALALVATCDSAVLDPGRRMFTGPSAAGERFVLVPYAQTAGMAFKWFRDAFGWGDYAELAALAEQAPPGCEGLVMLPHLAGATCPESNPDARGAFVGVSLRHDRRHFARAVMESVAFMLREIVEMLLDVGAPVDEVRVMGGGAKSAFWLQMMADALRRPVAALRCREAACLGAAILAGAGAGVFSSLEAAVGEAVALDRSFEPNPAVADAHEDAYRAYQDAYQRLYAATSRA